MSDEGLAQLPALKVINADDSQHVRNLPPGYLPKEERKTILLLSDDLRMPSGVGVMSREIVIGTAHKYNWIQLGAGINHPDQGKIIDLSPAVINETGIPDPYVRVYPYNGYGDTQIIRYLLMAEKPNAIMHFTDPRYWIWLYHMEAEIREALPITFYHVWDDLPFPKYNENFYRSCDAIACISKQTYNIVKNVWKKEPKLEPWQLKYIPHGVDGEQFFYKITKEDELKNCAEYRKQMFGGEDVEFAVLYNNRNIRRKMPGDVVLAFKEFVKKLPKEKADKCRLVFHTQPVDDNGTDIPAVIRDCAPEIKVIFSTDRVPPNILNYIYNNVDVVMNLASNEGFGLGTLEAIMAERMIVVNITGGLQDQMGFVDENGDYLDPDKHFGKNWGSNHDGRYKKCGEWGIPVFPAQRALAGSPLTPYIFDDRCKWEDAAIALKTIYDMSNEERERRGKLGREYAMDQGYNNKAMSQSFIDFFETTFANWKPRHRWGIFKS